MRIIKKVTVKHILTEGLKDKMIEDFKKEELRLEKEIEQLRFQMQKQIKSTDTALKKAEVKQRFMKEIDNRKEQKSHSIFQRSQLDQLSLGSEITGDTIEAVEKIEIGDTWPPTKQEIIVKDGEIVTIRKGTADNDGMV